MSIVKDKSECHDQAHHKAEHGHDEPGSNVSWVKLNDACHHNRFYDYANQGYKWHQKDYISWNKEKYKIF